MELTPAQKYLIKWLKVMKCSEDETIGIMILMDTPKKRDDLMQWLTKNQKATPSEILGISLDIADTKS